MWRRFFLAHDHVVDVEDGHGGFWALRYCAVLNMIGWPPKQPASNKPDRNGSARFMAAPPWSQHLSQG